MKKILSVLLATVILFAFAVCPLSASAIITGYNGVISILPGNTRSSSPEYNYAWLDNVIIRDDAMAVTSKTIVPKPDDYPGSHTYDEFIKEVKQYSVLFDVDENTVAAAYKELTNTMYYLVVAMGMTDELPAMRQYLQDYGIKLPDDEAPDDKATVSVVYAALKYDAVYALYEKETVIPVGTTLEGALVIILSALTNTMLPSGIDTLSGMAVNMVKTYVTQFKELPVSENPEADEVFHWAKVITAASNGYQVPVTVYNEATGAQKDYVDYAYYATVLNTVYDVTINPIYLVIARQNEDELALQKLILQTMLDEKYVDYSYDMPAEALFELAMANGCFALEEEFYSDILTYEMTVAQDCEKVWFTPFALADHLEGGNDEYISILLDDTLMKPAATVAAELDTSLSEEVVTMSVAYNDGTRNESATYRFIIKKDPSLNSKEDSGFSNDLVGDVKDFVNTIVPTDNEKVSQIVDNVFGAVDNQLDQAPDAIQDTLTTFGMNDISYEGGSVTVHTTSGYNFQYLEELFAGVYATDAEGNIVTTSSIFNHDAQDEQKENTLLDTVTTAVKENPEIIVAPTSLITLGSIAGLYLSKKQRTSVLDAQDEESEEEE